MAEVEIYMGFISQCYYMPLIIFWKDFPSRVEANWECDVGAFEEEQGEEALQAVQMCSLNVTQRLSQLYILLRAPLTPARLFKMGVREDSICARCTRDHGDPIYLLWRCPKLHLYWGKVLDTLNRVFQVTVQRDPKSCILGILDDILVEDATKQAIA